jgi:hypothetical protein
LRATGDSHREIRQTALDEHSGHSTRGTVS